jgi:hypothetical protein
MNPVGRKPQRHRRDWMGGGGGIYHQDTKTLREDRKITTETQKHREKE